MKVVSKSLWISLFIWSSSIAAVSAVEAHETKKKPENSVAGIQSLNQAYLKHWFSIDSRESLQLTVSSMEGDKFGERKELRFISDDGQAVNGVIAYPSQKNGHNKLALLMHPMGSDQRFWWSDKSPLGAHRVTISLMEAGYTILSLDARQHGERGREGFGPRELLKRAHSEEPRVYIDTIIGSVRDYRVALKWAKTTYDPQEILVMGYSMGAQMSLLLASFEPDIDRVVTMVPPFVSSSTSPVAPRIHNHRIQSAEILWLAGLNDPHSDQNSTRLAFDQIKSQNKSIVWFASGHRLPPEFITTVIDFINSTSNGGVL